MIFFYTKIDHTLFTKVGVGLISLLSLMRLISNHQKAPVQCSIQLHTKFQLIPSNSLPCRRVLSLIFVYVNKHLYLREAMLYCHQNWYQNLPVYTLPVYKISAGSEYVLASYSRFCDLCKKTKNKKNEEQKLKLWSLVSQKRLA